MTVQIAAQLALIVVALVPVFWPLYGPTCF